MLRYTTKRMFITITVLCVAVEAFAGLKRAFDRAFEIEITRVESLEEWPEHVRMVIDEARKNGLNVGSPELYDAGFWEYLLQCTGDDQLLEYLRKKLDLVELKPSGKRIAGLMGLVKDSPISYPHTSAVKFFVSQNNTGDSDDWYWVAYNEDDGTLLIWYYFNF